MKMDGLFPAASKLCGFPLPRCLYIILYSIRPPLMPNVMHPSKLDTGYCHPNDLLTKISIVILYKHG